MSADGSGQRQEDHLALQLRDTFVIIQVAHRIILKCHCVVLGNRTSLRKLDGYA